MRLAPQDAFTDFELLENNDSVTSSGIFIPLTALPALSVAEANPTTGNAMEIVRSVINAVYDVVQNLPVNDRPTKSSILRQDIKFLPGNNGNYERTYIARFELEFSDNAANSPAE